MVVKYTEGESKVTADNVNAENFLRILKNALTRQRNEWTLKLWCLFTSTYDISYLLSIVSDGNVILSEGLFLHVAAQIYILLMYNLMERLPRRKIFDVFTVTRLNRSTPPPDCVRFSTSSKKKKGKIQNQTKTSQKYRIDKPVISTFFFLLYRYKL